MINVCIEFNNEDVAKIQNIPIFNNTISRKINIMADGIKYKPIRNIYFLCNSNQ